MAGGLAQLVERLLCKQDVSGSSPLTSIQQTLTSEAKSLWETKLPEVSSRPSGAKTPASFHAQAATVTLLAEG